MILTLGDSTRLFLTGNQEHKQSYKGIYRDGIRFLFNPDQYTDPQLRAIFVDELKTKSMSIEGATKPLEGYTLFVRSVYEEGQIGIEMVKTVSAREMRLIQETEEQAAVVATILGTVPDAITLHLAADARANIERLVSYAPDEVAAQAPFLYRHWRPGEDVVPGDRRYLPKTDKLYRVREGQGHTTQVDWTPDLIPAVWEIINVVHTGTQNDPIPAARGMEYTYGLYYLDPEDGKLYLCERSGEAKGGKINLQYLPHEVVEQYFLEVSA